MPKPLCFVLMPFGEKPGAAGAIDRLRRRLRRADRAGDRGGGHEPLRADEELTGGIIHKPMFERLILCDFAVADLTTANANVFYELGVRHAVRPWRTVLLFAAGGTRLPVRRRAAAHVPYHARPDGKPAERAGDCASARPKLLAAAQAGDDDSPIFQLVDGFPPEIEQLKTDVFRERVGIFARRSRTSSRTRAAEGRARRGDEGDRARARPLDRRRVRSPDRPVPLLPRRRGVAGDDRARRARCRRRCGARDGAASSSRFALNRAGRRRGARSGCCPS